jgi:hypothetical protein
VGFVVDKVALGQVFSEYFGFVCQFSFRQMLHTHLSFVFGTLGRTLADVTRALSHTAPQKKIEKLNTLCKRDFAARMSIVHNLRETSDPNRNQAFVNQHIANMFTYCSLPTGSWGIQNLYFYNVVMQQRTGSYGGDLQTEISYKLGAGKL